MSKAAWQVECVPGSPDPIDRLAENASPRVLARLVPVADAGADQLAEAAVGVELLQGVLAQQAEALVLLGAAGEHHFGAAQQLDAIAAGAFID